MYIYFCKKSTAESESVITFSVYDVKMSQIAVLRDLFVYIFCIETFKNSNLITPIKSRFAMKFTSTYDLGGDFLQNKYLKFKDSIDGDF